MRGFSTIELLIAFAILTLVLGGVMLAEFSGTYWAVASETSSTALYKAKSSVSNLRIVAQDDFYGAISTEPERSDDATCSAGGLCYFLQTVVTDISACSTYVEVSAAWRVQGYPTSTVALPTVLTSPASMQALGGDCTLVPPWGSWSDIVAGDTGTFTPGSPTSLDVLHGVAYISSWQSPYLYTYQDGFLSYSNVFAASSPINALDVAKDPASGRTYAYAAAASASGQLMIIDVTDPHNPIELSRTSMSGVDPLGSSPEGWRLYYWDEFVYIIARNTAGPEFHIFDVSNPAAPLEQGSGLNLGTSAYGIEVREEKVGGTMRRFAYLATTLDSGEVRVVEVTNPAAPAIVATVNLTDTGCGLSDKPDGTSLFLSGKTLYVGRAHSTPSCPTLPDIYTLDITDPLHPAVVGSGVMGGGILGLRASGGYLFAYVSTQASPTNTALFDMEGDVLFAAQRAGNTVQVWDADPSNLVRLVSKSLTSAQLQLFHSI